MKVHIRWMIRRDMQEVLAIESECFEFPWTEEDFIRCLRQRNCIGMVAELDEEIVGFMIYELHAKKLELVNFAVAKKLHRQGIGRQMVEKLLSKLSDKRRNKILCQVWEYNLDAQLFFRSQGFVALDIVQNYSDEEHFDKESYLFEYLYGREHKYVPTNRIKGYLVT